VPPKDRTINLRRLTGSTSNLELGCLARPVIATIGRSDDSFYISPNVEVAFNINGIRIARRDKVFDYPIHYVFMKDFY
jgi:hypothetical protein